MSTFRIRKREEPWKWGALVTFPGALLFSLSICALLLLWQDKSVWQGMQVLWAGTFGETWALEEALLKAVPIFLCSLGVAVAFRMQIWNIGAEGQFALGAIGASWMALTFPGLPHWVLIPLMFLMALVLGSLWALVPAFLRLRLKVNEIISTLMLNYIAILLIDYLVLRVWKDPSGFPRVAGIQLRRSHRQDVRPDSLGNRSLRGVRFRGLGFHALHPPRLRAQGQR